jgi:hypothetical protein
MFKFIKQLFSLKDPIEEYLAASEDLADLENRMKNLRSKGIWV